MKVGISAHIDTHCYMSKHASTLYVCILQKLHNYYLNFQNIPKQTNNIDCGVFVCQVVIHGMFVTNIDYVFCVHTVCLTSSPTETNGFQAGMLYMYTQCMPLGDT